eukprot:g29262.t1
MASMSGSRWAQQRGIGGGGIGGEFGPSVRPGSISGGYRGEVSLKRPYGGVKFWWVPYLVASVAPALARPIGDSLRQRCRW